MVASSGMDIWKPPSPQMAEDEFIGAGHLGTHGGGHAETHGAEAAGVDPEARLVEADELGGPHLVLADVRADDGLTAGEAVDLIHKVLRLDFVFGMRTVVGSLFFPRADLRPPVLAAVFGVSSARTRGEFLDDFDELLEDALDVADDGDIGIAVLADFGRVDIDVNDAGVAGEGVESCR